MNSGVFTQGLRHLFVASIGIVALVGSGAKADQFQFIMDSGVSTISGSIGATTFTNATWSLSGIIDTANSIPFGPGTSLYNVAPTLSIYSGSSTHVYDYGYAGTTTLAFQFPAGGSFDQFFVLNSDNSFNPVGAAFYQVGPSGASFTTPGTYSMVTGLTTSGDGDLYTLQGIIDVTNMQGGLGSLTVSQLGAGSSAVPEPAEWAGLAMLGTGLGGLVVRARRRKVTA